ncbi:MAG: hypothetical protein IJI83_04210 [Oscillospiraceae bacterium]|nr:hypothetical protein [Oscillospiraceae bacterium]
MMKQRQCDRCGTVFEGAIAMCPSCGSTMVHEYDPTAEEPAVAGLEEVKDVQGGEGVTIAAEPQDTKEGRKKNVSNETIDHFDKKNKFSLLSAQNVFWSWLLMEIPVLGWIIAIFWSFGIGVKRQRREMARAFLVRLVLGIFLFLLGLAMYRWVFRLTLKDLPDVISRGYEWLWGITYALVNKAKT